MTEKTGPESSEVREGDEPPAVILGETGEPLAARLAAPEVDPLASPTLAALYAAQGDAARAEAIRRQLGKGWADGRKATGQHGAAAGETPSSSARGAGGPAGGPVTVTGNMTAKLTGLIEGVRGGRSAFVMDREGMLVAQASHGGPGDAETAAGECAGVVREVRAVAETSGWGELRTLSLRGAGWRLVLGFGRGDLVCGLETGSEGVGGQMRQAVRQTLDELGEM